MTENKTIINKSNFGILYEEIVTDYVAKKPFKSKKEKTWL